MSPRTKAVLIGGAAAIILFWILPGWFTALIILGVIAVPVAAYLMLDPSQKRRLRDRGRRRLGP
ncbi:hypothetical protein LO762_02770 [Actinocorallia sp. API 0066]|uniref:hypothetical protein n=1 Tax=Actinocorallia sp. API 0066 TaxID=2896846 RepID=UPI001E327296|nr:hypothetical protein [Actinocorallia sp. API 0066]MCD0448124.1 hypothetical protein [Actinocorallia sp. API 0066]